MTADNFKHNPPILQTNLKNVISKQLDTDNEQQMSNEQKRDQLFVLVSQKKFIPFI